MMHAATVVLVRRKCRAGAPCVASCALEGRKRPYAAQPRNAAQNYCNPHVCRCGDCQSTVYICSIIGLGLFGMGFPAWMFFTLRRFHQVKRLYEGPVTENAKRWYGFLYRGYREKWYAWECVVTLRKLMLAIIVGGMSAAKYTFVQVRIACVFWVYFI